MGLILRHGLGAGLAIAVVDLLTLELMRSLGNTDLAVAIELADYMVNLALFGWAGYRVAGAYGELRPGLEAAVLAGLVVGLIVVIYGLARPVEAPSAAGTVSHLAWNVVLAAGAGALGAWTGSAVGRARPPGRRDQ